MNYQKKLFMYHVLNIDNDESKKNHESLTKDDREMIDENNEYNDPDNEMIIHISRRNSCPALLDGKAE